MTAAAPDPAVREPRLDQPPAFAVITGHPTDEELVAVWTVLSAAAGNARAGVPPTPPASGWSAYWRAVRAPLAPGPGSWRAAASREGS